jgi:hypothetical protein
MFTVLENAAPRTSTKKLKEKEISFEEVIIKRALGLLCPTSARPPKLDTVVVAFHRQPAKIKEARFLRE